METQLNRLRRDMERAIYLYTYISVRARGRGKRTAYEARAARLTSQHGVAWFSWCRTAENVNNEGFARTYVSTQNNHHRHRPTSSCSASLCNLLLPDRLPSKTYIYLYYLYCHSSIDAPHGCDCCHRRVTRVTVYFTAARGATIGIYIYV